MATHLLLLSLLFFASTFSFLSSTVTSTAGEDSADVDFIRTSCNTTLYPDLCYSSLVRYATAVQRNPGNLARVAVAVTLAKAHRTAYYLSRETAAAADDSSGESSAVHDCFSNLDDAVDEIRNSLKQIRRLGPSSESFRFGLSNVQTWMSAALTDEDTCTDGFEDVREGPVKTDVCDRVTKLKKFTSNALALVNIFANHKMP